MNCLRFIIPTVLLLAFSHCDADAIRKQEPIRRSGPVSSAGIPAGAEKHCLPVVAPRCGCVYQCGIGWRTNSRAAYTIKHPFWGSALLKGRIDDWCVQKTCAPAFLAEIVCDGVCPPRIADSTCRFEGGLCVGKSTR